MAEHDPHPSSTPRATRATEAEDGAAPLGFAHKVAIVLVAVSITGALLAVAVLGIEILLVAFGGVLLAVLLRAITDLVARVLPLKPGWAYALVLVVLAALLVGAGFLLAPQVSSQVRDLRAELPGILEEVEDYLEQRPWGDALLDELRMRDFGARLEENAGPLLSGASRWFAFFVTVLFTALFGAANPQLYVHGTAGLFPLRHRARALEVLGELGHTLRWWLIGRAVAMTLVGVSTAALLMFLDVRFALLLGLVAGLFTFVPYLGPISAGVPILLFAALEGASTMLLALVLYSVVQLFEGYVLDPLLMHRLVYIPPVVTVVLQVLLGFVLGVLGVAVATPIAAVLVVLVQVYRKDVLGEPEGSPSVGEHDGQPARS